MQHLQFSTCWKYETLGQKQLKKERGEKRLEKSCGWYDYDSSSDSKTLGLLKLGCYSEPSGKYCSEVLVKLLESVVAGGLGGVLGMKTGASCEWLSNLLALFIPASFGVTGCSCQHLSALHGANWQFIVWHRVEAGTTAYWALPSPSLPRLKHNWLLCKKQYIYGLCR